MARTPRAVVELLTGTHDVLSYWIIPSGNHKEKEAMLDWWETVRINIALATGVLLALDGFCRLARSSLISGII